jgi:hypothetical protein
MILDGFAYLAITAAGVGFLITLIINVMNDLLLKKRLSVVHPDTMISVDFLKIMNTIQAMKDGMYSLLLAGWVSVFIFMLLWLTPMFQLFANSNIWVAACIYSFCIYIFMMLILMPLAKRGLFGVLYNPQTPYWSFFLLLVYAVLLALFVPVVL